MVKYTTRIKIMSWGKKGMEGKRAASSAVRTDSDDSLKSPHVGVLIPITPEKEIHVISRKG